MLGLVPRDPMGPSPWEIRERVGSPEQAIWTLHAAAGLGAIPLIRLVQQVAGLSAEEAKRLVVRALNPDWGDAEV